MSSNSKIEWTDATWNPVTGCNKVSVGCAHCYAETITGRFGGDFSKVICHEDRLAIPLHWRKSRMIFVNSMSDLFHEKVPFEFIDKVCAVISLCSQHTFQILTKRPERAAEYLATWPMRTDEADRIIEIAHTLGHPAIGGLCERPLPNVWLGTSIEDQKTADERIPHLFKCPAAVRFLSIEPILGPVILPFGPDEDGHCRRCGLGFGRAHEEPGTHECPPGFAGKINWVIVGGENGPGARPMHPDWVRSVADQCQAAGVPFFMKQICENGRKIPFEKFPKDLQIRERPHAAT